MIGGTLSKREEEELLAELSGDDEFAAEALELFRQGRLMDTLFHMKRDNSFVGKVMSCVRYSEGKTSFVEKVSRKVERRAFRPVRAAVAACLVIIAGTVVYNVRKSSDLPRAIVARIRAASPGVEIKRNGTVVVAAPGLGLLAGDRVETGEAQEVTFSYDGEETKIQLSPETAVELVPSGKGKRLYVSAGGIEALVAPQPAGSPMVVTTPHAEAEVVGTWFRLAVDGASTRLDVLDGVVRLTDRREGTSVDVAAGDFAVAGEGVALAARPSYSLQVPGYDEHLYDEGGIILKDGFDEGMDKWEVVAARSGNGDEAATFSPAGVSERACVRIVQRVRDGRKTECLAVTVPGNRKVRIGLRLKENVKAEAYVIEWDTLMVKRSHTGPVCPGVKDFRLLYSAPGEASIRSGKWFSSRLECRPVGIIEGSSYSEIRSFMDGKIGSRYVATFDHGGFILEVSRGQAFIDNVVMRELVKRD
jgi:hypothetical protein